MFKIGMPSIPASLDATQLMLANHFVILQCMCQTLVRVNETGSIVSDAASKWNFEQGGQVIDFRLKDGLKYSDGKPVKAVDVVASLNRHLEAGSPSAVGGYLKKVLSKNEPIKALDKVTIRFHLLHPYAPFLHVLAMPGFCIQKLDKGDVIGTGPLKVVEFNHKMIKMRRNENYLGDVRINELQISPVPSITNSIHDVDWTEIDLAFGVAPNLVERTELKGFKIAGLDSLAIAHLYFNVERRPDLGHPQRAKISGLLSKVAEEFRSSFFEPIKQFLPKGVLPEIYHGATTSVQLPTATSSTIVKPIQMKLLANIFDDKIAKRIHQVLTGANVPNEVSRLAPPEFLSIVRTGEYDLLGSSYTLNFPDADSVLDPLDAASKVRLGRFPSARMLDRLAEARRGSDNRQRLERYSEILREFEDDNYVIPLFRLRVPIVHREGLALPSATFRYEAELWKVLWKD